MPTYVLGSGRARMLDELADGLDARRPRELADLGELLARHRRPGQHGDDEPALRFRPGGGIGLAMGHGVIMTAGFVREARGRPEGRPLDRFDRLPVQVDRHRDETAAAMPSRTFSPGLRARRNIAISSCWFETG